MCCPFLSRGLTLLASLTFLIALSAACAGEKSVGGVGTSGQAAPFVITVEQMYITVANQTGAPLVDIEVQIIPTLIGATAFKASWPRLEPNDRHDLMLGNFRSGDGTPFRRGVIRARLIKVVAKDLSGKVYEQEASFK